VIDEQGEDILFLTLRSTQTSNYRDQFLNSFYQAQWERSCNVTTHYALDLGKPPESWLSEAPFREALNQSRQKPEARARL
jgi:hypothetical protein